MSDFLDPTGVSAAVDDFFGFLRTSPEEVHAKVRDTTHLVFQPLARVTGTVAPSLVLMAALGVGTVWLKSQM